LVPLRGIVDYIYRIAAEEVTGDVVLACEGMDGFDVGVFEARDLYCGG
jgi:hypothetical protein